MLSHCTILEKQLKLKFVCYTNDVIEPRSSDHRMSLSLKYGDVVDFTDIIEQLQQLVKVCCARATANTGIRRHGRSEKKMRRGSNRIGNKAHGTNHVERIRTSMSMSAHGIKCLI